MLGGTVLTKLDTTGDKSITYTPTGGLLYPQQSKDSNGAATVEWIERNPQGLTEVSSTGALSAYDPLGNYVPMQTIQSYGYTSPLGTYGPVYAGAGSSFGNANNYSTGCLWDGAPADCSFVMMGREGLTFKINDPVHQGGNTRIGQMVWVPDSSLDHSKDDLAHTKVTIYDGGGGHFEASGGSDEISNSLIFQPLIPAPQDSGLPDYAQSVYRGKLGKKLSKCINEIFGKYVDYEHAQRDPNDPTKRKVGIGSNLLEYQQLRNAPNVVFEDLGPRALGGTHPLDYQKGIVRLSNSNIVDKPDKTTGAMVSAFELGQRTYVHELGNYLSSKIVNWDPANSFYGNLDYFGDPNGITGRNGTGPDKDTGAALEKCVFGDVFP